MSELIGAAVALAERVVMDTAPAGDRSVLVSYLDSAAAQVHRRQNLPPSEQLCYLATLADHIGLRDRARVLLAEYATATSPAESVQARNLLGILAVRAGDYNAAVAAFHHAIADNAGESPHLGYVLAANLAATYWRHGRAAVAARWIATAREGRPQVPDPLADLLLEATEVAIARAYGTGARTKQTRPQLRAAAQRSIAARESDDPQNLVVLADLGMSEREWARIGVTQADVGALTAQIETIAQMLGTVLGDRHPETSIVRANQAVADFEDACAAADLAMMRVAVRELEHAERSLRRVLAADHPDVLAATGNLAAARLDTARAEDSEPAMRDAVDALTAAAAQAAASLGPNHHHAVTMFGNLASARLELARRAPTPDNVATAVGTLERAHRQVAETLGDAHPATVLAGRELDAARRLLTAGDPAQTVTRGNRGHTAEGANDGFVSFAAAATRLSPTSRGFRATAESSFRPSTSPPPPPPPPTNAADAIGRVLVRPYAVTRGRTRPRMDIAIDALVEATSRAPTDGLSNEQRRIITLCDGRVQSLAELSAILRLPLGSTRVLVADLVANGMVAVYEPVAADDETVDYANLLERVLSGLRRL